MSSHDVETIITPDSGQTGYWEELWRFRELFLFLAWRDLKVRYRQTLIGASWAIVRPLMTMVIFWIIFGKIAGLSSPEGPYPLIVFSALLPWQLFSSIVSSASSSLVGNANLLTKVFFPRVILPTSVVFVCLADFLVTFFVLLLFCAFAGYLPGKAIVFLPVFLLEAIVFSLGLGFWLAALNVRFRDFTHLTPFLIQILQYLSPVGFSSQIVPLEWRMLYSLNPLVGVIDGFRWSLLAGNPYFDLQGVLVSWVFSIVLFGSGLKYFKSIESSFSDYI